MAGPKTEFGFITGRGTITWMETIDRGGSVTRLFLKISVIDWISLLAFRIRALIELMLEQHTR